MTTIKEGDLVRYTEDFCRETSTTSIGLNDTLSRRGQVVLVFDDGKLCNVDWGDVIVQFRTDSPSIVAAEPPYTRDFDGDNPPEAEPDAFRPLSP
jgi:hypothetical protein